MGQSMQRLWLRSRHSTNTNTPEPQAAMPAPMSNTGFFRMYTWYISTLYHGVAGHTTVRGFFWFIQLPNQMFQLMD